MQLPNIKNAREIAAGGEGKIFEHPTDKKLVIKLYHQPRHISFENHLNTLTKLSSKFVKPIDVFTNTKEVLGFSMKYVNLSNYFLFNNLFNKGFCTSNNFDYDFKVKVLNAIKKELESLHKSNIIIGDCNQYNIFFSKKGDILFVDVDSYKTDSNPHSGVLLDDIRDWTTPDINSKTDIWAYDILSFWATTYCHPFKWVVIGNKDSLESRVKAKQSILGKIINIKIPPLYIPPVKEVLVQFEEVFQKGRRFLVSFNPTAVKPINVVINQPVFKSDLIIKEIAQKVTNLNCTLNQFTAKIDGKWHLYSSSILKVVMEKVISTDAMSSDDLYPANQIGLYCYLKDDYLYNTKEQIVSPQFIDYKAYFSNGSLIIFDYIKDIQWNYKIDGQLGNSIQKTQTSVFTKSILCRNIPMQNFGNLKKAVFPFGDTYQLVNIPIETKDGYQYKGILSIETKTKRQTEYHIYWNNKSIKEYDYLPFITRKDDLILVPDNGLIEVLDLQGNTIMNFNISICTRSSKLYYTASGILLLENNILYLLNTK